MDLGIELYLYSETIIKVFVCITILVSVIVLSKVAIHSIKNPKKENKKLENKEELK